MSKKPPKNYEEVIKNILEILKNSEESENTEKIELKRSFYRNSFSKTQRLSNFLPKTSPIKGIPKYYNSYNRIEKNKKQKTSNSPKKIKAKQKINESKLISQLSKFKHSKEYYILFIKQYFKKWRSQLMKCLIIKNKIEDDKRTNINIDTELLDNKESIHGIKNDTSKDKILVKFYFLQWVSFCISRYIERQQIRGANIILDVKSKKEIFNESNPIFFIKEEKEPNKEIKVQPDKKKVFPTKNKSPVKSNSNSPNKSKSPIKSNAFSPTKNKSPVKSNSNSPNKSKSPVKSNSNSPTKSKSPIKSNAFSPTKNKSPVKSNAFSPTKSKSPVKSNSNSPTKSKSPKKENQAANIKRKVTLEKQKDIENIQSIKSNKNNKKGVPKKKQKQGKINKENEKLKKRVEKEIKRIEEQKIKREEEENIKKREEYEAKKKIFSELREKILLELKEGSDVAKTSIETEEEKNSEEDMSSKNNADESINQYKEDKEKTKQDFSDEENIKQSVSNQEEDKSNSKFEEESHSLSLDSEMFTTEDEFSFPETSFLVNPNQDTPIRTWIMPLQIPKIPKASKEQLENHSKIEKYIETLITESFWKTLLACSLNEEEVPNINKENELSYRDSNHKDKKEVIINVVNEVINKYDLSCTTRRDLICFISSQFEKTKTSKEKLLSKMKDDANNAMIDELIMFSVFHADEMIYKETIKIIM